VALVEAVQDFVILCASVPCSSRGKLVGAEGQEEIGPIRRLTRSSPFRDQDHLKLCSRSVVV